MVFLDPLSLAWPVRDENDNAEADRQMWRVKQIAIYLNCTIIALWNMGEGNVKDKFRARGATARIDRSDVALNYTELTETTRQLKVVKSRYGTLGQSLTLRFSGDMDFEEVSTDDRNSVGAIAEMQNIIREHLQEGRKSRQELVSLLGNEDRLDKALQRMYQAKEVHRPERGVYELALSSEPPNLRVEDSEEIGPGTNLAEVGLWKG